MLKFLIGANLTLLAMLFTLALVAWGSNTWEAHVWWREAKANELEWKACETKHSLLTKAIRKEGLWKRLGMPGQLWLR